MKKYIKKAVILLIWLAIWQIIAVFVKNPIYFASPAETLAELAHKVCDIVFWRSVAGSLLRILSGFCAAFLLAFVTAFISHRYSLVKDFLAPFVTFLKSVPIAAVVVILLIWWGPRFLVLCISLMVVFPNIYLSMLTGLENADKGLVGMASVFGIGWFEKFLWIYRPAYLPHLHSAVSVALGMCFKSGIAAEIIGLPEFSAGERLYRDKIYLNTAGVFAWVIVILAVSALTERVITLILKKLSDIPPAVLRDHAGKHTDRVSLNAGTPTDGVPEGYTVYSDRISKAYDGKTVADTGVKLKTGELCYLKAPSGEGKTTLLEMIAGLVSPDEGSVKTGKLSMVFQDDRLVESANALRNLKLAGCVGDLKGELLKLIPERTMMLPVSELSGGERRRVAVARAVLHPSDVLIMDEPFAGLDDETADMTAQWILDRLDGRTLLYTSHLSEPDCLAGAVRLPLIDE